jgi:hypothetical protein
MKLIAIAVATWVLFCGWPPGAEAQTSQVTTEYLMTYLAPLDRHPIDGSTVIVNVPPGGWVKGPGIFVESKEVTDALNRGEVVTDKSVPYFVTAPTFQTSSQKYSWLNKIQAVGKMVELKRGEDAYIKYDVFIVR